jgi:hypothetical protein
LDHTQILKLNHILQILKMKTTSNGRQPGNIKSEIYYFI